MAQSQQPSLKRHLEEEKVGEKQAPVRACYRYCMNRSDQFNYQDVIENDLPNLDFFSE